MKKIILILSIILNIVLFYPLVMEKINNNTYSGYKSNPNYQTYNDLFKVYSSNKPDIVMLGDSLTQNASWDELIKNKKVVNRGITGDTTDGILNRLDNIIKLKPKTVCIMVGINDIKHNRDIKLTIKDYQAILTNLKSNNIKSVVFLTIYMTDQTRLSAQSNKKVDILNKNLISFCKRNNIKFVDLNKDFSKNHFLNPIFAIDYIHINAKAYTVWANKINTMTIQ